MQHPHLGHVAEIDAALNAADEVLVLVGSAQESGTPRNPFSYDLRSRILHAIYPVLPVAVVALPDMTTEDDIRPEWGRYVLEHVRAAFGGPTPDVMVYGNDENRRGWFAADDIRDVAEIVLQHNLVPIHATDLRLMIARNEYDAWRQHVHPSTIPFWPELRTALCAIPYYQEIWEGRLQM